MASATTKKTCAKCNKVGGTAMCYGCEQAFCTKHFIEHRQELSQQIDNIGQEHDLLRKDLTHGPSTHPLLTLINQWEQESIIKIQTAAESARTDLQQLLNKAKNSLKTLVSKMTGELQSSRDSDDYTELDIKKWTDQLQKLRAMLDSPTNINVDYENDTRTMVRLIKVTDQRSSDSLDSRTSRNLETSVSERFLESFGKIKLSERGLLATCVDGYQEKSCVSGINRYSSGIHYIRFRIEQINTNFYPFLGIVNLSEKLKSDIWHSTSCHGWWDLDYLVLGGRGQIQSYTRITRTGDEVTLILDCDNQRIQLEHHRTHRIVDMSIDLRICAFPWKIIVSLCNKDDCLRIVQ